MSDKTFDVAIVGSGIVGMTTALALAKLGLQVALIEAVPQTTRLAPNYDARSIALSRSSYHILTGLALWPQIQPHVTPITRIHVSERSRFAKARFSARESDVAALGYVVEAQRLHHVLNTALEACQEVTRLCPAHVVGLEVTATNAQLSMQVASTTQRLRCAVVIGADGLNSTLRNLQKIASQRRDYQQQAVVANVTPSQYQTGIAYERFTADGPLALLPLTDQRYALIWTMRQAMSEMMHTWDDAMFCHQLQQQFGYRLGRFLAVGQRTVYPLILQRSLETIRARVVLLGSAALHLHPVAGQGLNLGLRDMAALLDVIAEASRQSQDIGQLAILRQYQARQRQDQRRTLWCTDMLARGFLNQHTGLVLGRQLALLALDSSVQFKHLFARFATGAGRVTSTLASGRLLQETR